MNLQPQYAKLLADTARKIIQQEEAERQEKVVCARCEATDSCRCPAYDPIPPINIKDVLTSAGYNLMAFAKELEVCANCFEPYEGPPFEFKGLLYCCRSCAEGGDCICEPIRSVAPERAEHQKEQAGGVPKANSLWEESSQPQVCEAQEIQVKYNRLWSGKGSAEQSLTSKPIHMKTNTYWQS